jgi:RNA polymerase sigma factor (sigma-70 family)
MVIENAFLTDDKHKACPEFSIAETRLVEAAKGGQSKAFGILCERHAQQLLRIAHRITRSREDAEDAVQEALLKAFVHVRDFDGRSSFATWLTRIAINSALMILRKKRGSLETAMENTELGGGEFDCTIADAQPNPERRCAKKEEERLLKKAVQRLRPALREVVEIQHLQERSMQETAQMMGISVAAAKGRLFHAKAALRKSSILKLVHQPRPNSGVRVWSAA